MVEETQETRARRQAWVEVDKHRRRAIGAGALAAAFLVGALGYAAYLAANWELGVYDCAELRSPPPELRLELHGCVADLGRAAVVRDGKGGEAVYLPLRSPTGSGPAHVVVRASFAVLTERVVQGPGAGTVPWVGPRTFEGVRSSPLMSLRVAPRQLSRAFDGEAEDFVILHERGGLAEYSLPPVGLFLIGIAAIAAFFVERRSWRRHLKIARA